MVGPAAGSDSGLSGDMGLTLIFSTLAFSSLFAYMVTDRYRIRQSETELASLKRQTRDLQIRRVAGESIAATFENQGEGVATAESAD
jgi:hypothetical protein